MNVLYFILYTIDIPFLFKEILNYDSESFVGIINLANFYIENILNEQNVDLFLRERQESIHEMERYSNAKKNEISLQIEDNENNDNNIIDNSNSNSNIINTNSNQNDFDKNENNIKIEEDMIRTRKLNIDLIQPGYLPELENKLAEYKRAEKVANESSLKIDLMNKQINFINKYMNHLNKIK